MAVEIKSDAKAEVKAETKKINVAKTVIHVGEAGNVKVFQKGEEVKGISADDLKYLKEIGDVKEA